MGFVEGRFGQGTGDDLRHEVPGVPEVLGEIPFEVAVAEERGGVDLADLDPDSGVGGLLGEDLGGFDGSGLDGGGDEFDVESVGVARLGEELLRFVQVLLTLWELRVVLTQRPEHVVAHGAIAREHLFDHLFAVDDEPEGLSNPDVVEGLLVHSHGEGQPHAGLRVEDGHALIGGDDFDEGQRDAGDRIDLGGQEGVDESVVVVEVQHLHLVEVHLVEVEVVLVGHKHGRLGSGEGFEFEWSRAHRVLRIVADGDDGGGVFGDGVLEQAVGFVEAEFDGAIVLGDDFLQHGEVRCRGLRVVGVVDPLEGEDDVFGGDRFAVGELDALLQRARPHGGVGVGFDRFGQQRYDLGVVVPTVEGVVEVDGTADIAVVDRDVGVDGVRGVASGDADPQASALDGVSGVGGADFPAAAGAQARDAGDGKACPQRLSSVRCVHVPSSWDVGSGRLPEATRSDFGIGLPKECVSSLRTWAAR